jgi:regulator of sigma E protease
MDFDNLSRLAEMVIGIGLVIFVHEFGHFLAARLCQVRVEVFSLGFGPKLFGFRRGETLYQLAALPIGGFCRMAGEESLGDGAPPAPYELRAKPVGQRFFIYSGGVLMNVVFGVIVMPLLLFHGVPFNAPVIGQVVPGSGAWHARIEPGTRVLTVNGNPVAGFEYIAHEIALGPPDLAELEILAPGETTPRKVQVRPHYDEDAGFSTIGVAASSDPTGAIVVDPESAAASAGLETGDRVVGIDSALPELPLTSQIDIAQERGEPLQLRVVRGSEPERRVELVPRPAREQPIRRLGIMPALDIVRELRPNADLVTLGITRGDRIVRVNGTRVFHDGDFALALIGNGDGGGSTEIEVDRAGARVALRGPGLDRARALALAGDVALGLNREGREIALIQGSAALAAGLRDGDRLVLVDGTPVPTWEAFFKIASDASQSSRTVSLTVEREDDAGAVGRQVFTATPAPVANYGLDFQPAMYTYRAAGVVEAIEVGGQATLKFVIDAWTMVKRMLLGQVSGKNMGGIITIGVVSYSWAALGIAKLLFFLCMLSLQLAFLNVLPIPLLDGGHLFFLAVEKLKGSPVSERVFGYSQMVGLVLILSLVVYVTYNDIQRWGVIERIFGGS